MADAPQPKRNRHFTRHHADDGNRNRVRGDLLAVLDEKVVVLALADVDAAAAAADDDAGAGFADLETGVDPCFASRGHGDQRGPRVALGVGSISLVARIVAVHVRDIIDADAADGCGHPAGERFGVEVGDGSRAAAAAAHALPEPFAADPEGRDDPDAGDDDSWFTRVMYFHRHYSLHEAGRSSDEI